jgi:hypothetical protein
MKGPNVKNSTGEGSGHQLGPDRNPETVSFVMTVWLEPRSVEAEPEWRWRVQRVQSNEISYFRRVDDVLSFIAKDSGLPGPK